MMAAARRSPRRVRIFLAEKGIDLPKVPVDLAKLEQKSEAFRALNPMQRVPVLVLDDGTVITETMAICRYFEALHPEPNLFGRDALEIAKVEMWNRRIELGLYSAVQAIFRHVIRRWPRCKSAAGAWAEVKQAAGERISGAYGRRVAGRKFVAGDGSALPTSPARRRSIS